VTLDLDALEAVAKAATPGPWGASRSGLKVISADGWLVAEAWNPQSANVAHIAAFDPPTVLALIEQARRAS
jgi:hypothetical protein